MNENMIVSVYFKKDSTNTAYNFDYWIEGEEYSGWEAFWKRITDLADPLFYTILVCAGLCALCMLVGIAVCVKRCLCPNNDATTQVRDYNNEMI